MNVTLRRLRRELAAEARTVGIKPYSHNIVALILREISRKFGRAMAREAIRDFSLDRKGWSA